MAKCDIQYERGVSVRPAYVDPDFRGHCRVFPAALSDGREPTFLGYQTAWANDEHIMLIAEKSRQIGWTWTSAHGVAHRHAIKGYALDTWGTSRDDMQAMLAVNDCKTFATILHAGATDLGRQIIDTRGSSAHVLSFANGTKYYSLSSNPDAQAGKRGNRIGDEFALNKENRMLYAIMEPGVTWGGYIWLFSTHRGSANYFNTLLREAREKGNPKGWHVYRVTLQDALECGFLFKLQKKLPESDPRQLMDEQAYFDFVRSKAADEESFQQEYMCVPSDDATAFIPYELLDGSKIADADTDYTVNQLRECKGELFLGVDIGRTHDLTVFWVVERYGGIRFTRSVIAMQNTPFAQQEKQFYALMDLPNMRRAAIDKTGIGFQFAERGADKYGHRAEGVLFSGPVKEQLAYPVKAGLEDKTFRVPDDKFVQADFRSIRKEVTSAGNIRFAGDRTKDGHADRFWGAALALYAATESNAFVFAPCPGTGRRANARRARRADMRQRKNDWSVEE